MEDWKLKHYITNFTEACDGNPHEMIKHAKALKRIIDKLNNPAQETELLDEVIPLMDDPRAHVRQCAACVVMNVPIERFSSMPPELSIQRYGRDGQKYYDRKWVNTVPPEKQQVEWMEFVASHMVYMEDRPSRYDR